MTPEPQAESFRDSLYNVDLQGRRVGFFPRKPHGRLYNRRTMVSLVLISLFFLAPWISIGGEPLLLLDVAARRFVVMGQVFWPQDLLLAAVTFLLFIVSVVLFTAVFGRVWCGWACPQTIFLEMVFRKIEHLIEGDAPAQRRLEAAPWDGEKIRKRVIKHAVFLAISFLVANTVIMYFIGAQTVMQYITHSPAAHPFIFGFVLAFTALFYFIFSRLREMACIIFCPYGRLQGVFLDDNSVVISYDHKRGEPRTKLSGKKEQGPGAGDCIDCKLCIAVCPTGIDIRNGTQLECVNCTACIDACDEVMDKVSRPRGLIRFASHNMIMRGQKFHLTGRVIAYAAVFLTLAATLTTLVLTRSEVQATFTKLAGVAYRRNDAGNLENLYNLKVVNKTQKEKTIHLEMEDGAGTARLADRPVLTVPGESSVSTMVIVEMSPAQMPEPTRNVRIRIKEGDEVVTSRTLTFSGPF